jgi:hypothetical protein
MNSKIIILILMVDNEVEVVEGDVVEVVEVEVVAVVVEVVVKWV